MHTCTKNFLFACLCLIMFSACGNYEKVLKSNDINYKLTKANEYYDKKEYQHANELYLGLLPVVKGTKNFEPMYYRYAYSYYYMKDYLSSSYHFKNFVDFFPNSKDAEECEFMHAVSLYKLSPKFSLEQTNTEKAMEAMQSFINTHPTSKRLDTANQYIDRARAKLELKEADAAKLYYNISQYKAAGIAFKSVMRAYPESPRSDYYQYMVVKSFYNYARASVQEKQEERFLNVLTEFNELKQSYPNSKYLQDADKYQSQADNNLKKIRNEHQ
ncbi:outer membrane protein assembly factor BamD [Chitinophagaceae bacterium MMS25-I14]